MQKRSTSDSGCDQSPNFGKCPKELAVCLAGGNVTALNKANSGDICPIAVGEVLCCLAGICLCAALKGKLQHSLSHTSMEWPTPMELKELFMV